MLRIRLSRTGKKRQPSFRIVVAEHTLPAKGEYTEILGHYLPALNPKVVEVNKERVTYWISQGAKPSDSVATLLKKQGMEGMEKYMEPRNKKRKKKKEEDKAKVAPSKKSQPPEAAFKEKPAPPAEGSGKIKGELS